MARPLIAKKQVECSVGDGATRLPMAAPAKATTRSASKLTYKALAPQLPVIAPWREWDMSPARMRSNTPASATCPYGLPATKIYSRDRNIWHISHEGGALKTRPTPLPMRSGCSRRARREAPATPARSPSASKRACPYPSTARLAPFELLETLNRSAPSTASAAPTWWKPFCRHEIARLYETPGGSLILFAIREPEASRSTESPCITSSSSPEYAETVYYGLWFTPLREALDAFFERVSETTTGEIALLRLYKGNIDYAGRKSEFSLYRTDLASFTMGDGYNQKNAEGFIDVLSRAGARPRHAQSRHRKGQGGRL